MPLETTEGSFGKTRNFGSGGDAMESCSIILVSKELDVTNAAEGSNWGTVAVNTSVFDATGSVAPSGTIIGSSVAAVFIATNGRFPSSSSFHVSEILGS